jgi:large subunit ribosomal protein L34e
MPLRGAMVDWIAWLRYQGFILPRYYCTSQNWLLLHIYLCFPPQTVPSHFTIIIMPDSRWTQQGVRHSYATKSNRRRPVRTPGGKLVSQRICKKTAGPKCSDCKRSLPGIAHLKSSAYRRTVKRERTVSRVYGGSACHACVKERITRAFLLEEQKAVKKLMAERK